MVRIHFILVFAVFMYACASKPAEVGNETDSVSGALRSGSEDTIHNSVRILANRKIHGSDTVVVAGVPAITTLPFGPKISSPNNLCMESSFFYQKLIGEDLNGIRPAYTETYLLPTVRKVHYKILDSTFEAGLCNNDIFVDSLFAIRKYKYRLPDRGINEIYYMTNKANTSHDFSGSFERYCENLIPDFYGYLIVRNKKTNTASALSVYYEDYRDSHVARYFYIGSDYGIRVCNIQYAEGPNGADKTTGPAYEVVISNDGEFDVKEVSE